jgi:phage shock protein C
MEIIDPLAPKRLKRSLTDKMVAGVCGGLAKYFEIDSTLIRLIFAFAAVFAGTGVLAYIVMWIIVPKEDSF